MEYIASAILLGMAVLCQWLLSNIYAQPEETFNVPKTDNQTKLILFLLDLVFLIATLVSPQMSVTWRWSLWFVCWVITVVLVQLHFEKPKRVDLKVCVTVVAGFLFFVSLRPFIHQQWMEEQSLVTSGHLCAFYSDDGICNTAMVPMIEIGDSGSKMIFMPQREIMKFAYNVGLRIEPGPHGLEITTPIRDKSGQIIAKIEKNVWTVIPPAFWNYTDNALEVKDRRDQVVFQIRVLRDRVQIQAEWRDEFGRGQRWSKCMQGACMGYWGDARSEQLNEQIIEPIFQYPSSEHLGEFVMK